MRIDTFELEGDGSFQSEEITFLRDLSDIIVTNPPFSKWRALLAWIIDGNNQFLVLGTIGAVCYRDVFPLIKNNRIWLGATSNKTLQFQLPDNATEFKVVINGKKYASVPSCTWFTNMDTAVRHTNVSYLTTEQHTKLGHTFVKYDNYDAIEVPKSVFIPSDYTGVMGVPVSFLSQYNPDLFEIVGSATRYAWSNDKDTLLSVGFDPTIPSGGGLGIPVLDGKPTYSRLLIRNK